ncbi:S26 family signal peptidase [Natronobeatus ordinarius]|uniref:S26 family signal peptidase n=1 Tax=Natronobeatus ordinarius TaxID=2963433 RepID=UPI0020CB9F75|nr:S26 family signal peptidase [Natronobeatus ordinarius]
MSGPGPRDSTDEPDDGSGRNRRADGDRDRREQSSRSGTAGEDATATADDSVTIEDDGVVRWFLKTDDGRIVAIRDVLTGVAIVAFVGLVLFGLSGVWPPMVAVESGSMEPNMQRGDLVFVVDENRFVGDDPIDGTGIVTYENGAGGGHEKFGEPGDVIIFQPNGDEFQTPIIHRAYYWVEEGDNWVDDQADPAFVNGASCEEVATCPAEHDGFVTRGDANNAYDQVVGSYAETDVVKPEWVTGKAMIRIPYLGYIRLAFESILTVSGPVGVSLGFVGGAVAIGVGQRYDVW